MIKLNLVVIFLIHFLFFSCHSDEKDCTSNVPLPSIMKQYVYLAGSYWIYKNDSTGVLDNNVVISVENDYCVSLPCVHGQRGTSQEYYKLTYFSSVLQSTYLDFICYNMISRNGGKEYCLPGQPIYDNRFTTGYNYNGLSVIQYYPYFTINGVTFNNVIQVKITQADQLKNEFDYDTFLFYAAEIGIIKKQIFKNNGYVESWSLINMHIVR